MFSTWAYFVAALAIALAAFALGQIIPGAGVPFVAFATTTWTAHVVARSQTRRAS